MRRNTDRKCLDQVTVAVRAAWNALPIPSRVAYSNRATRERRRWNLLDQERQKRQDQLGLPQQRGATWWTVRTLGRGGYGTAELLILADDVSNTIRDVSLLCFIELKVRCNVDAMKA